MLGKDRFNFESPNAIDAGEAPPCHPGRRGGGGGGGRQGLGGGSSHGTRSPRSVTVQPSIAKDERLFRGTKIKIDDNSGRGTTMDEETPVRRCSMSTTGSFEGSLLEFYDGDEGSEATANEHDQLPSPDEARMYAAAVLTESFRRHGGSDSYSSGSDEEAALAFESFAYADEAKPLSSSAVSSWRRPSRRKSTLAQKNAATLKAKEERRKSFLFLSTTVLCSVLLIATAVAFFVVVSMASFRASNETSSNNNSNSNDGVAAPADVTSEMVDSPRFLQTIDWLSEHEISSMKSLTTKNSPQYEAAVWIADVDKMQEEIPVTVAGHHGSSIMESNSTLQEEHLAHERHVIYERFLQRYILAVLFFAMGGPNWTHDLDFLSPRHECAWFRGQLANDGNEYAVGVTCNDKLLVQDIFLPNNKLEGKIPSEISHLRHLELLSLRHNNVQGNIPTQLTQLSSTLEYLDLSKNSLTGRLPGDILGGLPALKALGLAGNQLSGPLPTSLSTLTNLLTLDLGHNQLTSYIKTTIGPLTNLKYLYLENNQFEDTIDNSFLLHLSNLNELTLNSNKFQSVEEIPFHLVSHPELTLLDLSNNFLEGSLPKTFLSTSVTNSKLKVLNMRGNQIQGTIPSAIDRLTELTYLDLSQNALTGTVPVSMGNLKGLTHVYLGQNNFAEGIIPPAFFTILKLEVLSLPNTRLVGHVPQWVGMLSDLSYLDLRENKLTGSIPNELWGMPALSTLMLSDNKIESTLPDAYPETQLEILALDDNNGIEGNATGICESASKLQTFAYSCDQVVCTGACCHSECCASGANEQLCFSSLLSASLQVKDDEDFHFYEANRTIFSFSPSIIREKNFN